MYPGVALSLYFDDYIQQLLVSSSIPFKVEIILQGRPLLVWFGTGMSGMSWARPTGLCGPITVTLSNMDTAGYAASIYTTALFQ